MSFDAERKAARKAAGAAETLGAALKTIEKADDPFTTLGAVNEARKAALQLTGSVGVLDGLQARLDGLATEAEREADRSRARLMGGLDDALRPLGLRLAGRLPALECGPLTLVLHVGQKPELQVWYGPRIAKLDACAPDPEAAAAAVTKALAALDGQGFDDAAFLAELRRAWRAAVARDGLRDGEKAPITRVLGEFAVGRQSPKWQADPSRSGFKEYTRVQFSHDLGRLKSRRLDDAELQLTVATRDQTKKDADHLWVGGTHYAFVAFRSL